MFYTVLNATLPRKKGVKTAPKRAYIVKWHVNADGWKADRVRKVGDKGVASFDIRYATPSTFEVRRYGHA